MNRSGSVVDDLEVISDGLGAFGVAFPEQDFLGLEGELAHPASIRFVERSRGSLAFDTDVRRGLVDPGSHSHSKTLLVEPKEVDRPAQDVLAQSDRSPELVQRHVMHGGCVDDLPPRSPTNDIQYDATETVIQVDRPLGLSV
jgi:hypothetical protein